MIAREHVKWLRSTWRSTRAVRTSAWRVSCWLAERGARAATWRLLTLLALLCIGCPRAQAQTLGPLVVVVSSNPDAPFVRRLAAELSLFGYRVEVASRAAGEADLGELLQRSGGAALIAVDQGRQTAEVIVGDAAGAGPARHERERLDPRRRADTNAAVLAERFRARLTELGIVPGAGAALPPADSPVAVGLSPAALPEVEPEERRLWLAMAVGATTGGLAATPDIQLELRAFPVRWLSTGAFAKWSPIAADVSAAEGEAKVRLLAGGLLIDAYPWRRELVLNVGLGLMLVSANMEGRAAPPWGGRSDAVLVPAGMLQGGAGLRLSPRVSAELRAFVGACSPRIGVRFAGHHVADYGQPFLGASLGVSLGLF